VRGVHRELIHRVIEENDHLRQQLNRLIAAYERVRAENEPHWSAVTSPQGETK
jgi:hypothetical protein